MEEKKPVYLIMVTAENNNKYYNMMPDGDSFTVKYGRIGGHESSKSYPMSKWDAQLKSKLKKGYVARTDLMTDIIEDSKIEDVGNSKETEFSVISNTSVREIIKRLFDYANKVVQSSYKIPSAIVTQDMIDRAQELIDDLSSSYEAISVDSFNEKLLKIFSVIPRKMSSVQFYLAKEKTNFTDIIQREQDTLDAMRGQVYKKTEKKMTENSPSNSTVSVLDKMGITMEEATDEDVKRIKKAMGDAADKFYKAWRVSNKETEDKYKEYISKNNINNIKLTCHGSRNQNWFNILKTGLKIRPSGVVTTGNMFGIGLYFSNPDKWHGVAKSIGYTSLGGYWTKDYQNAGFIAFFETALGPSYDVYSFDSKYYNFNLKRLKEESPNAWNLFAHGGTNMLRNDEIIVYNDAQTTIRYLVEIR